MSSLLCHWTWKGLCSLRSNLGYATGFKYCFYLCIQFIFHAPVGHANPSLLPEIYSKERTNNACMYTMLIEYCKIFVSKQKVLAHPEQGKETSSGFLGKNFILSIALPITNHVKFTRIYVFKCGGCHSYP